MRPDIKKNKKNEKKMTKKKKRKRKRKRRLACQNVAKKNIDTTQAPC